MKHYVLVFIFFATIVNLIIYHTIFEDILLMTFRKLRIGIYFYSINNTSEENTKFDVNSQIHKQSTDYMFTKSQRIDYFENSKKKEIVNFDAITLSDNNGFKDDSFAIESRDNSFEYNIYEPSITGITDRDIETDIGITNINESYDDFNTIKSYLNNDMLDSTPVHNQVKNDNKFLIETKGCSIVFWPVFDFETEVLFYDKSDENIKCKKQTNIELIRLNATFIQINDYSSKKSRNKCYASIQPLRGKNVSGDTTEFTKMFGPLEPVTQFPDTEFVKISCFDLKNSRNLIETEINGSDPKKMSPQMKRSFIYEELVPLIPDIPKNKMKKSLNGDKDRPNILLLGLDSISRLNFERHFTKTKILLKEKGFYTLFGYNKVGLNTFPNMFPLLTGKHPDSDLANESISHSINYYFDNESIIWKKYSENNYRTLFIEDWPLFTIFNYLKKGFKYKPTDYYLRPFSLSINKEQSLKKYCYKSKFENKLYYDYVYDFVTEMNRKNENYFAFIFLAHLTHDYANNAGYADKPSYDLLKKLFDQNLVNNTIIMFFADHGIRYGNLRQTHSGEMEAKLPFFHIYLPKSISDNWRYSLSVNQKRLTTPFDIHSTLLHIIDESSTDVTSIGKSLFEVIPEDRTCANASIPDNYCACHRDIAIKVNKFIIKLGKLIVDQINSLLSEKIQECHELVFDKALKAYKRKSSQENQANGQRYKIYLIQISVNPSKAIFEASVKVNNKSKPTVVGDISRLNKYGNQSHCVQDLLLERFCFCKDINTTEYDY